MYFSFHSYGQLFMFPWGYTDEPHSNYDAMVSYLYNTVGCGFNLNCISVHRTPLQSRPKPLWPLDMELLTKSVKVTQPFVSVQLLSI